MKASEMRTSPGVYKRSGSNVWQWAIKAPRDLQPEPYATQWAHRCSLGTADLKQANAMAAALQAEWMARFERQRAQKAKPDTAAPLTTAAVRALLAGHVSDLIDQFDARAAAMTTADRESWDAFTDVELDAAQAAIEDGRCQDEALSLLGDALRPQGLRFEDLGPVLSIAARAEAQVAYRDLIALKAEAAADIDRGFPVRSQWQANRRALGTVPAVGVGPAAALPAAVQDGPRLSDVVDYWKGQGSKTDRSKAAADTIAREFVGLHGDLPVAAISKGHFVALRDAMLQRVTPATVQARFNLLRAAFRTCLEDDRHGVQSNPLESVRIRNAEPTERSRDVFSVAQLQALFDSAVFTEGARPAGGKQEAAFWAPLIALFTGARLDEVLSLRTDGIYEHEGVWVLHFQHRPALGQNLKGKLKNNRRVPLHPELVRLGLVAYWREVSGAGPWLFPGIDRSAKARSHSSAWGAWFGRYVDSIGITDDKVKFHSFRHTFKHHARACMIPEDHQDAMTGHQTAEVARRYGSAEGYPIAPLHESLGRLRFGALDLSRVRGPHTTR